MFVQESYSVREDAQILNVSVREDAQILNVSVREDAQILNVSVMILLQPNASLERDIFVNIGIQDVADDDPTSARLSIGMCTLACCHVINQPACHEPDRYKSIN